MIWFFCLVRTILLCMLCALQGISVFPQTFKPQNITVIGSGYVGLVSGCALAWMGHTVTCLDINQKKIDALNQGIVPIYEPNLDAMIAQSIQAEKLRFSGDIDKQMQDAQVVIIAVGTPMDDSGQVDMTAFNKAVESIGANLKDYKVICIKSTVPLGTNEETKRRLKQLCGHENFDVISNPEFLREGSALADLFEKNPVVLGGDSDKAFVTMEAVYRPLFDNGRTLIKTNFATAELIKYAWNAFSAIKISYVNELAQLCNKVDASISDLVFGMSFSDDLLPMRNIKPGPGLGGSCLPKDTRAFALFTQKLGSDLQILQASIEADGNHKQKILADFYQLIGGYPAQKTIAVLGLAFKAETDDVRSLFTDAHDCDVKTSPAIMIIKKLLADGAYVKAYDPIAMGSMKALFPSVIYCNSSYEAAKDADALLLLTDWGEFKELDLDFLAGLMKKRVLMDARNIWNPSALKKAGFVFKNLGRV